MSSQPNIRNTPFGPEVATTSGRAGFETSQTNKQTDIATLWQNQPKGADTVKTYSASENILTESGRSFGLYIYCRSRTKAAWSISSEALAVSDIFKRCYMKMLTGMHCTDRMPDRRQSAAVGQAPISSKKGDMEMLACIHRTDRMSDRHQSALVWHKMLSK